MEAEDLVVKCKNATQMLEVSNWFKENNEDFELSIETEYEHNDFLSNHNFFNIGIVTIKHSNNNQIVYTDKIKHIDQYKPFKKISYEEWLIVKVDQVLI